MSNFDRRVSRHCWCRHKEFLSNTISVAWRQISSTRCDIWNCCNFSVHCSISLKLHLCVRHTVWPWRGIKVWRFAKKEEFIINPLCIVQSFSKLSHMITMPAWTDPYVNVDSSSQHHLLIRHETGCFFNSTVDCPTGTKILTYDQSPDLNRSISLYIVIAPSTGNRK